MWQSGSGWRRREFLKACAAATAGTVAPLGAPLGALVGATEALAAETPSAGTPVSASPVGNVKPEIGTGWRGHMFPGAVAPFGLVQLSPDTAGPPETRWNERGDYTGWDHCPGYYYPDNAVIGFSHTHVQGTGGGDLGDILLMPVVEGRNWAWDAGLPQTLAQEQITELGLDSGWVFDKAVPGYRSFFSHDRETARAGYYGVHLLTPDVQAELTATSRCGMHRYSYPLLPTGTKQGVLLDLVHGIGCKVYHAELKLESATRISGMRATHGWAEDKQVYFVMEFSRPLTSIDVSLDGAASTASPWREFKGTEIKAMLAHAPGGAPLVVRVGISSTTVEGAAKNLAAEMPLWDFDAVAREAGSEWSKALSVLDAELPTRALTDTFYTDAYRGLVAPATFNDVDGTYRGQDRQNHPHPGFTKYTTLSIWDIYRGEVPFIMLMQPHRTSDIVRTLIADYEQLGLHTLPMWPLWGNETWSMTGFHAAAMIVAAYVRGFRDFDAEAAYAAIRDTALGARDTAPPGASARDIGRARDNGKLQEDFRKHGYVPMDLHGGSVSCTLDIAYDYWCAGAMAELLGKKDDAALFSKLALNYKNVYDPSTGFMRPKTVAGKWRDPFEPDIQYPDYVETDAWQASFSVPHDVQGLIDLHGGDAAFIAKLDGLFTAPSYLSGPPWPQPDISGMVGQDAQGNEPSNHHPYLYPFAGAAWKTQYWVRKVAALYNNTPAGIPGNDDCGQLASWFVFAALGFYPVNAATGVYIIGSPMVNRAAIRNPQTGKTFTIVAENNSPQNVYIQSAELNGKEWNRSWITHAQIVAGGDLHFRMGPRPNKEWASAPADRPPSGLVKC
jgi:predicted alpha-1,2-mannosidase